MQNGRVGGQARVHSRRGRGGLAPLPLEMGKKMLSEEILTSFSLLLMKLGRIDKHCIHAKWKGVGGQALVHGKRGWGQGGFTPPPPPLENEKRNGKYRPISVGG